VSSLADSPWIRRRRKLRAGSGPKLQISAPRLMPMTMGSIWPLDGRGDARWHTISRMPDDHSTTSASNKLHTRSRGSIVIDAFARRRSAATTALQRRPGDWHTTPRWCHIIGDSAGAQEIIVSSAPRRTRPNLQTPASTVRGNGEASQNSQ